MAGLDEFYRFIEKQEKGTGTTVATPNGNGEHADASGTNAANGVKQGRAKSKTVVATGDPDGFGDEAGSTLSDGPPSWQRLPSHILLLARLTEEPGEEVAAKYYTRGFKESRQELIERLLDPTLTLEETARVLGVCPATVRRYTNRGVLPHYRTVGQQRRFRLSDVLRFLERTQTEGIRRAVPLRARVESDPPSTELAA